MRSTVRKVANANEGDVCVELREVQEELENGAFSSVDIDVAPSGENRIRMTIVVSRSFQLFADVQSLASTTASDREYDLLGAIRRIVKYSGYGKVVGKEVDNRVVWWNGESIVIRRTKQRS